MSEAVSQPKPGAADAPPVPQWRKARGTRHPLARQALEAPCPVAKLAGEAAQLLRLRIALGAEDDQQQSDGELVEAFNNPNESLRADCLQRNLFERLRALRSFAGHCRPTSIKGALFQLYVAAEYAQATDGYLSSNLSGMDEQLLGRRDRQIERLHRAAITHLESLFMDDDLAVLRDHYLPQRFDVHATCQRAIHDRRGLIAELKQLPSTWKEHATAE